MPKQIRLNAFDMNCVGHQSPGLWTHPRDRADSYNTLEYWTDLARILERGKFDALFLADVLGIYDVYKGSPRTALEQAVQVPVNDPLMVIPAMALVTEHLGFGVTCALSYEHPYPFARRMTHAGPPDQGPHRLEHRHRLSRKRRPRHGPGRAAGPRRRATISPRTTCRRSTSCGRQAGRTARCCATAPAGASPMPDKIHRISTRAVFQGRRHPSVRAVAATHAGAVPGRRLDPRPAIRRRSTRNACSSTAPRRRSSAASSPIIRRRAAAAGRDPAELLIFTMMTVITDDRREARRTSSRTI